MDSPNLVGWRSQKTIMTDGLEVEVGIIIQRGLQGDLNNSPNSFAVGVLAVSRATTGLPPWSGKTPPKKTMFFYCFLAWEAYFSRITWREAYFSRNRLVWMAWGRIS